MSAAGTVKIQAYTKKLSLDYQTDSDTLYIAYSRNPNQAVNNPSNTLVLQPIVPSPHMAISNKGTGAVASGTPYQNPLEHIAVNDIQVTDENVFNDRLPLMFPTFTVDSGYVERPAIIPGSISRSFTLSVPRQDAMGRWFYSVCSSEFTMEAEGVKIGVPRKIFTPMLCLVEACSDNKFVRGEYVMVIFSKNEHMNLENVTGFINGANYAACVYRVPNRPLTRI
jgi:hypothetical protein